MKATLAAGVTACAVIASPCAFAQTPPAPKPDEGVKKLEKVTVTASPLGREAAEMAQPVTVLSDEDLRRKRASSIGDTLGNELGVSSSAFGAGSGRPIIRGLDGPRIRVMQNGIGTLDASTLSPDHMVTTEALNAEQIEILRGPASLLYGSGAIGGVVNVVSNLIPRKRLNALEGTVEGRLATGNDERTGAFDLGGGSGNIAWRLNGFQRRTSDYKIPDDAHSPFAPEHGHEGGPHEEPHGRLPNSDVDARGLGAGASWVGDRGYLGASVEGLRSDYGIPSGEGVRIKLRQDRTEVAGELNDPMRGFTRARLRFGATDYMHDEIEATGEVGTTFRNKANETRFELAHAAFGGWTGTVGLQHQDRKLSALGEEAIIPRTKSRATGVFVVEETDWRDLTFDAGLRYERESRHPDGELQSRDFNLVTPAMGIVWRLSPDYRLGVSLTQAQRAPSIEELYTLGAHHATATFEIGDANLKKEVSRNVDVTLRKATGDMRWKVNVYANRIRDYVYAASQDTDGDGVADRVDADGALDPEGEFLLQRYSQARARFHGLEAELTYRPEGSNVGVRVFGDMVRGKLEDGTNLPRIAPGRIGIQVDWRRGDWTTNLTAIHAFEAKRLAPLEAPTPAYTRVDGEIAWQLESGSARRLVVFLQGTNLLNREIRLHTSYLKDVAPLMGRSLTLGLRGDF